jgi:hypothetical protein
MPAWELFVATAILIYSPASPVIGATVKSPETRTTREPRARYYITVTVANAPGPFDRVEGMVDYRVENDSCVPLTPGAGATVAPEKRVPVALVPAGGNVYTGEIYTDLLQDEDYYGKGVCHWSIVAASANLFVKNVDFSAPLFRGDLLKGTPVTRYYSHRSYATAQIKRVDIGETDQTQYKDEANATFSVTLRAEERRP